MSIEICINTELCIDLFNINIFIRRIETEQIRQHHAKISVKEVLRSEQQREFF